MKKAGRIADLEAENAELREHIDNMNTLLENADTEAMESIRAHALALAHNPDSAPTDVVTRAKAYSDFIVGVSESAE